VANGAIAGCKVRAVAKDLPANETVYDVTEELIRKASRWCETPFKKHDLINK
jgi:hypothetical protein